MNRMVQGSLEAPDRIRNFLGYVARQRLKPAVRRNMVEQYLLGKDLVPVPAELDVLAAFVNGELQDTHTAIDIILQSLRTQLWQMREERLRRSPWWLQRLGEELRGAL